MDITFLQGLIYLFLAIQMLAWIWLQKNGGKLSDRKYYFFCFCMMLGQSATCIEAMFIGDVIQWGTFFSQLGFLISTAFGWVQRYRKRTIVPSPSGTFV